MIDLQAFCRPEKEHLDKPFDLDRFAAASNAYVVVREVREERIGRTLPDPLERTIRGLFVGTWRPTRYLLAACYHEPKQVPCSTCTGNGLIRLCPNCHGDGCDVCRKRVYLPSTSRVMPDTVTCDDCEGTGRVPEFRPVLIEDVLLGSEELQRLIQHLPGDAEIQLGEGPESPVLITGTGVEAVLMPLRANVPSLREWAFRPTFPQPCEIP